MSARQQTRVISRDRSKREGFTLVEILTVIVIIGILAAITVPAVSLVMRRARTTAIRMEIDSLSQALEAYKLQYGEYPPDFYDWGQVERHFRKAFPNIDDNELRILSQFTHYDKDLNRCNVGGPADPRTSAGFAHYPHAIDRAEALVFCLGGFSNDDKRPFTGQGGPLVKRTDPAFATEPDGTRDDFLAYQYNIEREIGLFDFDISNLSSVLVEDPTKFSSVDSAPFAYSNDEFPSIERTSQIGSLQDKNELRIAYYPDPFPIYRPGVSELPVVYFNSNNYDKAWGIAIGTSRAPWNPPNPNRSHHYQNVYLPNGDSADTGVARPYASSVVDTTPPGTISGLGVSAGVRVLQFAENNQFQLVSAGLDNNYGGLVSTSWGASAEGIGVYPTGEYYNPFRAAPYSTTKYQDDLQAGKTIYNAQPQLDNVTNFSSSSLEADSDSE
jgi:prepilin-type N-terminal cleavage/methylation domain-containing protein